MKIFKASLLFLSIFHFNSFAINITNTDIMSQSCRNWYGMFTNCNFSSFTDKKLTNKDRFSTELEFKVQYSKGKCCVNSRNGRCDDNNDLHLKMKTDADLKSFQSAEGQAVLYGHALWLQDDAPSRTYNLSYSRPCHLVIRKIEIDLSLDSKSRINHFSGQMLAASQPINMRDSIFRNIRNITYYLENQNYEFVEQNLQMLMSNIQEIINLNEEQNATLNALLNRINLTKRNKNYRISNALINQINQTLNNLKNRIDQHFNDYSLSSYGNYRDNIRKILDEVRNEENFNRSTINHLKSLIGE